MTPNVSLLERYGTFELYKEAKQSQGLSTSARIAAAILSMGIAQAARNSEQDEQLDDRAAEEHARYMESKSMEATLEALKTSSVRYAQDLGVRMAHEELEKDASLPVLGAVGRMIGKGLSRAGKGLQTPGAVAGPKQKFTMSGDVLDVSKAPRLGNKPSMRNRVGQSFSRAGGRMQRAGGTQATPVTGFPSSMGPPPVPKGPPPVPKGKTPSGAPDMKVDKTPGSLKPAPAANKPLISTKHKLMGAAGLGVMGAGYVGSQALGMARDVMLSPRGGAQRYGASPGMRQVSQYGYASY